MASYSERYSEVVFPDRTWALGKLLQPVTIGHALLLCRDGSPFVCGGDIQISHLVRAVYILSRPCATAAAGLQRRRTRRLLRFWESQVRFMCGKAHIDSAIDAVENHLSLAYDAPEFWEREHSGRKLSSPFLLLVKMRLMSCFHVSSDQAMDTPLREALWETACFLEEQARVEWVSSEHADAIERLAARN